jgi:hypothetical protein
VKIIDFGAAVRFPFVKQPMKNKKYFFFPPVRVVFFMQFCFIKGSKV